MVIKIKKLKNDAIIPTNGTSQSAGSDLYACLDGVDSCVISPHNTYKVSTGLAVAIPNGYFGALFARSGIATKRGLRPANCVGVIDSDYRGEIIVALHNDSDIPQKIDNHERIAQLVILPCPNISFQESESLEETARGDGGFGSTGTGVEIKADEQFEQLTFF